LLFHNVSPLSVVQLYAELNGGRYLEAEKEADGSFGTKISGSFSVAELCCRPERTPSTIVWVVMRVGCGLSVDRYGGG
jgi:hypothetical protein